MGFLGQFWLLTWKNFVVMRRSPVWTTFEIVSPLLCFAMFYFIYTLPVQPTNEDSGTVRGKILTGRASDFDSTPKFFGANEEKAFCPFKEDDASFGFTNHTMAYTIIDKAMKADADALMAKVSVWTGAPVKYIEPEVFQNTLEENKKLSRSMMIRREDRVTLLLGGVRFSEISATSKVLRYELLIIDDDPMVKHSLKEIYMGSNPFDLRHSLFDKPRFCQNGAYTYKIAIDSMFAGQGTEGIWLQPLAFRKQVKNTALLGFFYVLYTLVALTIVIHVAKEISGEKETGMKDFLMVMGMGRSVFFTSHISLSFAKAVIVVIINCIPTVLMLQSSMDASVLINSIVLFVFSLISIAACVTALVVSSSTATKAIILVLAILGGLTAIPIQREQIIWCYVYSLNPIGALKLLFMQVDEWQSRGQYLSFNDFFFEGSYAFPIGGVVIMLLVDCVLYLFLAIFFDWLSSSSDSPVRKLENALTMCFAKKKADNAAEAISKSVGSAREHDAGLEQRGAGIDVRNVRKIYSNGERAVDGLNLKCYHGQVTVLLGHNGAGKSTTFGMVCGLLAPTAGQIFIDEKDVSKNLAACQHLIGYCPQGNAIFPKLSVFEHLEFFARLRGVKKEIWKREREELCTHLALMDHKDVNSKKLSGGMKRKLCVAMAMIGQSRVVLLDEPTAGMDPGARRDIERLLQNVKGEKTILMTTHYTDEAEQLGDRIAIMAKGRVVCCGTPQFLKKKFGTGYILTMAMHPEKANNVNGPILDIIKRHIEGGNVNDVHGQQIEISLPKEENRKFPGLFAELERDKEELGINSFGLSLTTLEQVFLKVGQLAEPMDNVDASLTEAMKEIIDKGSRGEIREGPARSFQQFGALLLKRIYYTYRHPLVIVFQFVVPLLIIWLSEKIALMELKSAADSRNMDLNQFGFTRVVGFPTNMTDAEQKLLREEVNAGGYAEYLAVDNPPTSRSGNEVMSIEETWYLGAPLSRPPILGIISKELAYNLPGPPGRHEPTFLPYSDSSSTTLQLPSTVTLVSQGETTFANPDRFDVANTTENPSSTAPLLNSISTEATSRNTAYTEPPERQTHTFPSHSEYSSTTVRPSLTATITVPQSHTTPLLNSTSAGIISNSLGDNSTGPLKHRRQVLQSSSSSTTIPQSQEIAHMVPGRFHIVYAKQYPRSGASLLNLVNRVRFKAQISANLSIVKPKADDEFPSRRQPRNEQAIAVAYLSVIAFALLTGPFVTFPIIDKTSKFAHQQYLTGVSPALFWFSNALYDFAFFAVGAAAFLGLCYVMGVIQQDFGLVIATWFLYYWAQISFIYCASFIFSSSAKAQVLLFIIQALVSTVLCTVFLMMGATGVLGNGLGVVVANAIFMTFVPTFAVAEAGYIIRQVRDVTSFNVPFSELAKNPIYTVTESLWAFDNAGKVLFFMGLYTLIMGLTFTTLQFKIVRRSLFRVWVHIYYRKKIREHSMRAVAGGSKSGDESNVTKVITKSSEREDSMITKERVVVAEGREPLALRVNELTKWYGKHLAVDNLSFGVRHRECFGLLGVNGAGKTSTFNIITGVDFPTKGSADLDGVDVAKEVAIGYCPQFDALLPDLSGRQCLEILAALHGYKEVKKKVDAVLRVVGMSEHAHKKTKQYSGGQRRKISVGVAILAHKSLIILDEPTAGVDPKARREIWQLLVTVRDESDTSLLLTSHSMDECEALCSRIGILQKGRLVALGNSQELKSKYSNSYVFTLVIPDISQTESAIGQTKVAFPDATLTSGEGSQTLVFELPRSNSDLWSSMFQKAIGVADSSGAVDFCLSQSSLEDTFMRLAAMANIELEMKKMTKKQLKKLEKQQSESQRLN